MPTASSSPLRHSSLLVKHVPVECGSPICFLQECPFRDLCDFNKFRDLWINNLLPARMPISRNMEFPVQEGKPTAAQ
ncbi:hypothetical protein NC651_026548 [Populus alba x Populus x berolinensis]|nr:hypothetical protein NC651_026548 [Populus alba x Populus x berolinensis]